MEPVSDTLKTHYAKCFAEHGATARGVDWHNTESLTVHYDKMLAVIDPDARTKRPSLLDVGCGWGGLFSHAKGRSIDLDYTGIDIVPDMVAHGSSILSDAHFVNANIFEYKPARRFDYVVANGALTEKLDVSHMEFDQYARRMIRRMFELADIGIAFNVMTTYVNFFAPNLYYKSPVEMIAFCAAELSSKFRVDHAYQHYDYTMYVYRQR